jgi:hypothetical protein
MMRKTSRSKKPGRRAGAVEKELAEEMRITHPPQVQFQIRQTHRLRFTNTGTNPATSITYANLLETVVFAAQATVAYQMYDYVRVKEVEMWASTGASTVPCVSLGLDFAGLTAGNIGAGRSFEDASVSPAYPAHIRGRPDPKSQTAQFQPNSASPAFHIRGNGVSIGMVIVDVTLEFTNSPVVSPVVSAVAGATPGTIYFRGLDGLANGSTAWRSLMLPDVL